MMLNQMQKNKSRTLNDDLGDPIPRNDPRYSSSITSRKFSEVIDNYTRKDHLDQLNSNEKRK